METLWEIGKADGEPSEFALWPDGLLEFNSDFPLDPLFVVGHSDPKRDWPFFHPGPVDEWVGSRQHTYMILFAVDSLPAEGDCRLLIQLHDSHRSLPPKLRVSINGSGSEHQTAPGSANWLEQRNPTGHRHEIAVSAPVSVLRKGRNTITITSLSGCWLVYDRIALAAPTGTRLGPVPSETQILRGRGRQLLWEDDSGGRRQGARLLIQHTGAHTPATITINDSATTETQLRPGIQRVDVTAPAVEQASAVTASVRIDNKEVARLQFDTDPVRDWVIYLIHHTHVDIGYTHVQSEVEALQWKHLEQAIELGKRTRDFPPEARFVWNPESIWAVDSYIRQATQQKRERLMQAIKDGTIGLDALYANTLTGLCRPEELFELLTHTRDFSDRGIFIDAAMITDIPGYTWGIIPALAHSGVKYFSIGPNRSHRIGHTLSEWGDRPFYWISPSGEHKILSWMAGKGYSWFHGPWKGADTYDYTNVESTIDANRILDYLDDLHDKPYPYDLVQLRYNIGSDNGPPDPRLPHFVKDWNARHVAPKFVITTTSKMMRALEERYGSELPTVRGDFTPYWEDGAASSARETAVNRATAERLVQAEILWSILRPGKYPVSNFREAWQNVLLFDEHTWGSWNSISDPEADFTRRQWETKRQFALNGDRQSRDLLSGATAQVRSTAEPVNSVQVLNTSSWTRTDLILVPKDWTTAGDRVHDGEGNPVPSQRLTSGELAFLAAAVPPLSSAKFTLQSGECFASEKATANDTTLANGSITVDVDQITGAIASLIGEGIPLNLVDRTAGLGLNDYLYVAGRTPDEPQRNGPVTIRVKENGPLVASLVIESSAPGCRSLSRELRVVAGLNRLDIIDVLDKNKTYDKESVHLAFPFNVPGGTVRMDIPWGVMRPGRDQLPGACKNHFTVGRWVDISSADFGVTWIPVDAPLVELGRITADPIIVGWLKEVETSTTLYSYVMNNYWETNYKASQEGPVTLRYSVRPHGRYDSARAKRFGIEQSQPLVVVPADVNTPSHKSMFRVDSPAVIVTSIKPGRDGRSLMVRLFNTTDTTQEAKLVWGATKDPPTWISNPRETKEAEVAGLVHLAPWGILTLRCENR